jgi:hypothetical protein
VGVVGVCGWVGCGCGMGPSWPCHASGSGMAQKPHDKEAERLARSGMMRVGVMSGAVEESTRSPGPGDATVLWVAQQSQHFQRDPSTLHQQGLGPVGAAYRCSLRPRTRAAPAASSFPLAQPVGDAWLR